MVVVWLGGAKLHDLTAEIKVSSGDFENLDLIGDASE
jgi:hypothetical protein